MQEEIINTKNQALSQIMSARDNTELEQIRIDLFGRSGKITKLVRSIKDAPESSRKEMGSLINETKKTIETMLTEQKVLLGKT